ncbi:G-type lectin S-receptor-like serine/threonine-protein kinase At5g24080 [Triticum dicoccoides]|uniref:G-type lectin S-receptor-like serine/threonine-protein kinase At5g24080 n=1 Tax=Triticum dicoccoides TaxID=85692 RepID=UPI000E78E309|nr:G-type lectin S-receptor-like serine/threonine-protein kinase At5g24080 [Triticum dicoccoides]
MAMALLPCLLLLAFAGAQAQQMASFPAANDATPWLPTETSRILVSPSRGMAAGFVPSESSTGKYRFAVWVANVSSRADGKTVIWYAHRGSNASDLFEADGSSTLVVNAAGVLTWAGAGTNTTIWTLPNGTNATAPRLTLNDTGSLIFGSWSSFGYPTHTLMPGQAIPQGNNGTGTDVPTLQSANGRYRLVNSMALKYFSGADPSGSIYANMSGGGTLLNLTTEGELKLSAGNPTTLIASDKGARDRLRRLTLDDDGNLRLYSLLPARREWRVVWELVQELCTIQGTCPGNNTICVPKGADGVTCVCPPGFRNRTGAGGGCEAKKSVAGAGGKFVRLDFVSFSGGAPKKSSDPGPYMSKQPPSNLEVCRKMCRDDPGCPAFGYKFGGDRTCLLYKTRLVDGYWSPGTEMSTFVRVAETDNDTNPFTGMTTMIDTVCPVQLALPVPPKQKATTIRNIAIITTLFAVELLAGVLSFWAFLRKYSQYREMARTLGLEYLPAGGPRRFSYAELKTATKDFTDVVGRGAYGTVFRGELPDRRAVAVKQLHGVGGGEAEFWAEVTIIARMHHLNLVRMWGFCADKDQRMLVYEYVPNGSLDKYLFSSSSSAAPSQGEGGEESSQGEGQQQQVMLDLHTRYRIALGVARAIAYLHEECLEWVLHCDIKPENILLEDDFCPKVSDFGLSKLTSKKEKVTMSRIRGTRGYMAPEWVIHREPITAKADVYSFGMVLLEIVSGRRNYGFRQESVGSEDWYFPKWAYEKVYVERRIEDIMDPRILLAVDDDADSVATVERMVKTAMWCLQDRADMRPSMGKVAKMLEGTVEITDPVKPTIFCVQDD